MHGSPQRQSIAEVKVKSISMSGYSSSMAIMQAAPRTMLIDMAHAKVRSLISGMQPAVMHAVA
jgi:hypothetical protein